MSRAESFTFNGKQYFAKELTAREIDLVLTAQMSVAQKFLRTVLDIGSGGDAESVKTQNRIHVFDLIFMEEAAPLTAETVQMVTGITMEELDADVSPIELEAVYRKVLDTNPFLGRAVKNGKQAVELAATVLTQKINESTRELTRTLDQHSGRRPAN